MTEEEKHIEELKRISDITRKKRYRCMDVCPTWNSEDHDCEIYGWQHPAPSRCRSYLEYELEREEERKEDK